jgi:hypothetical protein
MVALDHLTEIMKFTLFAAVATVLAGLTMVSANPVAAANPEPCCRIACPPGTKLVCAGCICVPDAL